MAIQQAINQAINLTGAAYAATGTPQLKKQQEQALKEATLEQNISDINLNKRVESGQLIKSGEGKDAQYSVTRDNKLTEKDLLDIKDYIQYANQANLKYQKLSGDIEGAASTIMQIQDTESAVERQIEALRRVERDKEAKVTQETRRKQFLSDKKTEAIVKGREDVLASGLKGKALDIALKESDKYQAELVEKKYKGIRGLGR